MNFSGTGTGTGISLSGRTNVTVKKPQITAFEYGLYVYNCTNSTISGNNIVKNGYGVFFESSSSNSEEPVDLYRARAGLADLDSNRRSNFSDGCRCHCFGSRFKTGQTRKGA